MIIEQGLPEESVIFRSRVNDIKVTISSPNAECFYFIASQIPSVQNRRTAFLMVGLGPWCHKEVIHQLSLFLVLKIPYLKVQDMRAL